MATASVVYRKTAGAGPPEVQSLATLKTDLGLTGTNSGDQTITLTGDVTGSGTGSFATTIGANKVTDAMLRQSAAYAVIGRATGTTGNVADITAADNTVLRRSGTSLAFGAVDLATAMVTGRLPYANITAPSAASRLLGRGTTTGDWQETTLGATLAFTGTALGVASVPNSVTWNNGGAGAASGSTYNGSAAITISYNTIGALPEAPRIQAVTSAATVTPTFSNDQVNITAQAAGLTLANPTGTAIDGKTLIVRIKDNGGAQTIAYGTQYRAIGVTLPTTTVAGKTLYLGLIFNNTDTKWDCVAVSQEA